jgi:cold shock CspA family protein
MGATSTANRTAKGYVKKVLIDRGFGFIHTTASGDVFFHRFDLRDGLQFDEQLLERFVQFEIEQVEKGLRAKNIRPAW